MKYILKTLLFVIVLASVVSGFIAYTQYQDFLKHPITLADETLVYEVKKGSSLKRVANELEQQGVMQPAYHLLVLAKLQHLDHKLKAGEYELTRDMKPQDVLELITSGKSMQYRQTIIEGKTFKELVESIKNNPYLKQTLTDEDYQNINQLLGADVDSPEGLFFPDTYLFPKNTTDLQFLQRSYDAMKAYLQKSWQARSPEVSVKTPYEALILASIVEKETGDESERPMIARVFINRLDKGMMLQTDPTVIYGMGEKYEGNIRKSDLKTDTPYNTYTRNGLPPTPIATPGRAALDAVMHPPEGDAFYFVAKGDGTSHFSENYDQHRKAVVEYQLKGDAKRYTGDQ